VIERAAAEQCDQTDPVHRDRDRRSAGRCKHDNNDGRDDRDTTRNGVRNASQLRERASH
jgi:hypothetical protein